MRVRDHVAISTAVAVLSRRWLGRNAIALWAGAILIDSDHYLAFCLQERRVSPTAAVRFYDRAVAPDHWATRAFHTPLALLAVSCMGARVRPMAAVAVGMGVHVTLDVAHGAGMSRAGAAALERDRSTCQACGARTRVSPHLSRQPWLLPSYRPRNLVCLCTPCHVLAHTPQAAKA